MPPPDEWQDEIRNARRREAWSLAGPNRVVKVVPLERPLAPGLKGYVCLEKALLNKTPAAIESALGLPRGFLAAGCRVYRLERLPMSNEVEYELTTAQPDGLEFNAAMHDASYLPGNRSIHQWRLLTDLPVAHVIDLPPGMRYPYLHH